MISDRQRALQADMIAGLFDQLGIELDKCAWGTRAIFPNPETKHNVHYLGFGQKKLSMIASGAVGVSLFSVIKITRAVLGRKNFRISLHVEILPEEDEDWG